MGRWTGRQTDRARSRHDYPINIWLNVKEVNKDGPTDKTVNQRTDWPSKVWVERPPQYVTKTGN